MGAHKIGWIRNNREVWFLLPQLLFPLPLIYKKKVDNIENISITWEQSILRFPSEINLREKGNKKKVLRQNQITLMICCKSRQVCHLMTKQVSHGPSWPGRCRKSNFNQTLTQKDLLFPHGIGSTHHKRTWVERHQFKGCAGCKIDDLLLSGEGVLRAAVAGEIRELTSQICTF